MKIDDEAGRELTLLSGKYFKYAARGTTLQIGNILASTRQADDRDLED
jgi:hypothetical protein